MDELSLPDDCRPFLRTNVKIDREGDSVFALRNNVSQYGFEGEVAEQVGRVLKALGPTKSLAEVAKQTGLELDEVKAVTTPLYAEGVLAEESNVTIPAMLFLRHGQALAEQWEDASWETNRMQAAMTAKNLTPKIALGYLLEEWHYIRVNPDHASAAVLNASSRKTQQRWAEFAADERVHGDWLYEGLSKILKPEDLERAVPLPGTEATNRILAWAAARSELGYSLCLAMGETNAEQAKVLDPTRTHKLFDSMGLVPKEVLEPFYRHDLTDVQVGHLDFVIIPFQEAGPLTFRQRRDALTLLWQYVVAHNDWVQGVYDYYSNPANPQINTLGDYVGAATAELKAWKEPERLRNSAA